MSKQKKQKKEKTYSQWFSCDNCSFYDQYKIKKGITREEFWKKAKCRNCGIKFTPPKGLKGK